MPTLNGVLHRLRPRMPALAAFVDRVRPPTTRVVSRLHGGVIVPPSHLELIVADHCNIVCRSCNHGSPAVPRWLADPEVVRRDLAILAKVYRPRLVKLLGGEPLLHRDLAEVVRAARSTGISDRFLLTTNGLLLPAMADGVWDMVDEVEISCYPGAAPPRKTLDLARERARRAGVKLRVVHFDHFRDTITTVGTEDRALVQQIYATCKIANVWGCHGVREGWFYKCPQSMYIPMLTGRAFDADRVRLEDAPDLQARLLAFVNSREPLGSCRYCVGSVGKRNAHVQLKRADFQADLRRPTEELVDYEWLKRSALRQDSFDDCKIETNGSRETFRPHR
jgi:hypothetical protein